MTDDGRYFHPEQVMQTVVSGAVKYFVRGTSTEVHAVKMTDLVKPVNGGRLDDNGKKHVVVGTTPTSAYALASDKSIRFLAEQVESKSGKFYIKGTNVEVVALPASYETEVYKADGTGKETVTAIDMGVSPMNLTGDPNIDNV
jgi:hypothetical protein